MGIALKRPVKELKAEGTISLGQFEKLFATNERAALILSLLNKAVKKELTIAPNYALGISSTHRWDNL